MRKKTNRRNNFRTGFEEMPTNNFIESSLLNFDGLFQPQKNPSHEKYDSYF